MLRYIISLVLFFQLHSAFSQCTFQYISQYDYPPFNSPLTNQIDKLGRPYLYVASNELGLRIFKTNSGTPVLNNTLDTNDLLQHVMSVSQYDTLLYVSTGSHFDTAQSNFPCVVVVSVADPENPVVLDSWMHSVEGTGTGIVVVEGDFAYVGGMTLGLFILNVADPNNIFQVGSFLPTINYPILNPPANQYGMFNARGMEVKNGIVYLCYDRGGLRIINCTNPSLPIETGRFVNPIVQTNVPRAYNNIILNDTLAYVAVDYCGVEILDIRDTSNIILLDHYNPHACPSGYWWTSPIHANEMHFVQECNKLMVAGGKSELNVLDVSDPLNVSYCGGYGSLTDTTGTWGLSFRNDTLYLSYVFSLNWPPFSPFWGEDPGIRMVKWTDHCAINVEETEIPIGKFKIVPNPSSGKVAGSTELFLDRKYQNPEIFIYDMQGKLVHHSSSTRNTDHFFLFDIFEPGLYLVSIVAEGNVITEKLIITP